MGDIFRGSNQDAEALAAFDAAIAANPEFRPAVDQRLQILIKERRWSEAEGAFLKLYELTQDPEVKGAILKRVGELYEFFLDRAQEAIPIYEQALTLGGDTQDLPNRLLRLYLRFEFWERARVFAQALADAAKSTQVRHEYLLVLGDVLLSGLGLNDQALSAYLLANEIRPDSNLCLARLGRVYALDGNLEAMAEVYSRHLAILPEDQLEQRVNLLCNYGEQLHDICKRARKRGHHL